MRKPNIPNSHTTIRTGVGQIDAGPMLCSMEVSGNAQFI